MKSLLAPLPGYLCCPIDFNATELRVWAEVSKGKSRSSESPTGLKPRAPEWSRNAK